MGKDTNFNDKNCMEQLDIANTETWEVRSRTKWMVSCVSVFYGLLILFGLFIFIKYLVFKFQC